VPTDDLDERGLPARIAGWIYGIVLGLLFGWPFGVLFGARGLPLVLFVIVSMFVAGYTVLRITTVVPEGMAQAFLHLIWPNGSSTPYEPSYSREQALAARGDEAGALQAYEAAMRLRPMDPEPRFQAAEMLLKSSTPERAARYFAQGRRLSPDDRARELYATQRLIDLYWGKLQDHPRARAELRQLITRFPGTREAAAAQNLLDSLIGELPRNRLVP
jgi:thioredoxin-like negative regulator of GroEL